MNKTKLKVVIALIISDYKETLSLLIEMYVICWQEKKIYWWKRKEKDYKKSFLKGNAMKLIFLIRRNANSFLKNLYFWKSYICSLFPLIDLFWPTLSLCPWVVYVHRCLQVLWLTLWSCHWRLQKSGPLRAGKQQEGAEPSYTPSVHIPTCPQASSLQC